MVFNLWLELAECELLTGHFDEAERLLAELLPRVALKVDDAAVYCLKIQLYIMKSEHQEGVTTALTCLRGFGIDLPAYPTEEEVESERQLLSQTLGGRSIEGLIDLPLMTDPELQAAMKVLSALFAAAQFTESRLSCLQSRRMVTLSVRHGISGGAAFRIMPSGARFSDTVFHRYSEGYRFSKLACDVVEKHHFTASRASVYCPYGVVAAWTQPIGTAIELNGIAMRAAIERLSH